ncbi:MAG: conjugal transfer protein TraD [Faecalibacterium sp.]
MRSTLKFTRRTWYFFLLAAAGISMLNGFAVLAGQDLSFLETISFCMTAIAVLFLAARKGAPSREKGRYFGVFMILMLSYLFAGWIGYIASALAWPALLAVEYRRGAPIPRLLQLVGLTEALHLIFVLFTVYGGIGALSFWSNVLWVLLAAARGAAALKLYQWQEEEA